ncbi:MAG: ABC transporter permease [Chloroflexota bacterium]|nr:ABC transporter permease [Chloroflexota bacterium]
MSRRADAPPIDAEPSAFDVDTQGSAASAGVATSADQATAAFAPTGRWRRSMRRLVGLLLFLLGFAGLWEGAKWLAGDPWRLAGIGYFHDPPFRVLQLSDRQLPHLWDIFNAFSQPFQRNAEYSLGRYLVDQALYTWTEALLGFGLGALIGIALASVLVHSGLLERAFVPYVVASQTVPIVALAPLIVTGFGRGLTSVVIIATYLTFFPVTIAVMRGLRSPDPRAVELMRSYAASRWDVYRKVRLPASVPYLFTALKIAAAASLVGTIIGEGPGGVPQGLGRAILNFNQQYITGPERLWATIVVASILGITFFLLVRAAEIVVLRQRGQPADQR